MRVSPITKYTYNTLKLIFFHTKNIMIFIASGRTKRVLLGFISFLSQTTTTTKKLDKYQGLTTRRPKKIGKHEGNGDTNPNWSPLNNSQESGTRYQMKNWELLNYSIAKIG